VIDSRSIQLPPLLCADALCPKPPRLTLLEEIAWLPLRTEADPTELELR